MDITLYEQVEEKILEIQSKNVLLDSDVAELYGVTTKQVNQAVSRNQEKFPEGYILALSDNEKNRTGHKL